MAILLRNVAAIGALSLVMVAAHGRQTNPVPEVIGSPTPVPRQLDWAAWQQPLGNAAGETAAVPPPAEEPRATTADIDVVDAHWMALTIWGEARGEGEEGMRAVGHVIHNRWQAKRHGAYVTETVSEAFQFSCWNADDPNREAMLDIASLPPDGNDYRLWLMAKNWPPKFSRGNPQIPPSARFSTIAPA